MKQISHDELRTRLIGAGCKDLDTLEEKMSCYDDCQCASLKAQVATARQEANDIENQRQAKHFRLTSEIKKRKELQAQVAELEQLNKILAKDVYLARYKVRVNSPEHAMEIALRELKQCHTG